MDRVAYLAPTDRERPEPRLVDQIESLLAEKGQMTTRQITDALADKPTSRVRQAIHRLAKRGAISRVGHGVWRHGRSSAHLELTIPGATTENLVQWVTRTEGENPIAPGAPPFLDDTRLVWGRRSVAGVTVSINQGSEALLTIELVPGGLTDEEKAAWASSQS